MWMVKAVMIGLLFAPCPTGAVGRRPPEFEMQRGFDSTRGYPGEGPGSSEAPKTISLMESLFGGASGLSAAREVAVGRSFGGGFSLYYANVTSWSMKAQGYAEHSLKDDAMAFVETHLASKDYLM